MSITSTTPASLAGLVVMFMLGRLLVGFGRRGVGADCWAIGGAQVGPVDIRSQILTPHRSSGGPLDLWAILSGDTGPSPLLKRLIGVQIKRLLRGHKAAQAINGSLYVECFGSHLGSITQEKLAMQAILAVTPEIIAATISP